MTSSVAKLAWSDFERQLLAASVKDHLPVSGTFELTYRCNFACVHCYQQDVRQQAELPADRWCELVDEVARAGTLWVALTGGEPFLHPGFDRVYERAVRAGLLVTVFSNGSSLTRERVGWLSRLPPRTLEVTLYGFSPESYGRVTGRPEDFELAVNGVRRAAAAGLSVQVKTMVFQETLPDFEAIRAFAAELGQPFRFDTTLHAALGGSRAPSSHRLSPGEVVALESTEPAVACELARRASSPPSEALYQCGAGRFGYCIAPDGALKPCSLVRSVRFDLAAAPFEQAWRRMREETGPAKAGERCRGCRLRAHCPTCPGLAELETGDARGAVEHLCELARLRSLGRVSLCK